MRRLYLIRHGEPTSNWGDLEGSRDPGLSERGRAQAAAAADTLWNLDADQRPTRTLTSPLHRCRETAAPFARRLGLEPVVTPAVAEIPTPTGMAATQRTAWLKTAMAGSWSEVSGIDAVAWRGLVVEAMLAAGGCAIFTHFVAINAAITAATGSDAVLAFHPAPGSVTTLAVDDGRLSVIRLGEALSQVGRVL